MNAATNGPELNAERYHVNILYDILKRRMAAKHFENLPFVQQRIHQIRTIDQLMWQTRIDNFQNHSQHLFQYAQVL